MNTAHSLTDKRVAMVVYSFIYTFNKTQFVTRIIFFSIFKHILIVFKAPAANKIVLVSFFESFETKFSVELYN